MHGDDPDMTKMRMSFLATDRIKQLERFDILVGMAAGQDMENFDMIDEDMCEKGVKHPGYSKDVVDAVGPSSCTMARDKLLNFCPLIL